MPAVQIVSQIFETLFFKSLESMIQSHPLDIVLSRILYQNSHLKAGTSWIIPGFGNGYRTLARPRAVFIDFAVAGDSDHMPSSGQELELHLQVAVLLPDAIEAAPSAVADEEPAQAVCDRVVEELGRLIHLSRDLRDMVRERLEFSFENREENIPRKISHCHIKQLLISFLSPVIRRTRMASLSWKVAVHERNTQESSGNFRITIGERDMSVFSFFLA